jgi:long-subunit fatty acid transport protein
MTLLSVVSRTGRAGLVTLVALAALHATSARALTDEEVYRTLRFSQSPPGARAMGMGGAVIAVADDPGATFSNPAGLGFLDRPQVLVDMRGTHWDDTSEEHIGEIDGVDTLALGTNLIDENSVFGLHFVGYAHPVGDKWTIAGSRHEWLSTERDVFAKYETTKFPQLEGSGPNVLREGLSTDGRLDMLMDVYSVAAAFAPVERFSMGVTVSAARLDVVSDVHNLTWAIADTDSDGTPDTFLRPVDYETLIDDDQVEFTWAAGLLWRPMDTLALGVVYRDGPQFDLVEKVGPEGVRAAALREYLNLAGIANVQGEFINTFALPDSYGVGLSFGPYFADRGGQGLTVAVDAVHVEYADLLDGYTAGLNNQLFGSDAIGTKVFLQDQTEYHAGVGYSWTVGFNNAIHVRVGAYSDADHSVLTAGRGPGYGGTVGRDDVWHGTVGAGFTVKRGFYAFEMDTTADISDLGEQYFGSLLFKF